MAGIELNMPNVVYNVKEMRTEMSGGMEMGPGLL